MSLPDKRLDAVLDKFTDRISQKQHVCMRKLALSRNEEIQFGRFINNTRFGVDELKEVLYSQFKNSCPQEGHLLLIEDFSQMAFSLQRHVEELGSVDKGQVQGFYLQPVLCLDALHGGCYGIPAVNCIKRSADKEKLPRKQANALRDKIPFEDKESFYWLSTIAHALENCPQTLPKTVVADREADVYAVLVGLQQLGVAYVIRARHDRPLQQGGRLYEEVSTFSEQCRFSVKLPATDKRSAHTAVLKVSYGRVELKKSQLKSRTPLAATHSCWAVKVEEDSCSVVNNEAPIEWLLLTTHQVDSPLQALQVIGFYKERWNVEQLFRLLKTKGLHFEASQLRSYAKLLKLMMLSLMGAVKVLQLLRARNDTTGQKVSCAFSATEQLLLSKLNEKLEGRTEKLKNPYPIDSLAFAAWVIARLSGWSGYQSQRPPGPIDFFVGLQHFEQRLQGFMLAMVT